MHSLTYLCKGNCFSSPRPHWYGKEMPNGFKRIQTEWNKRWIEQTNRDPFLSPQCHSSSREKRLQPYACVRVQSVPKWDYVYVWGRRGKVQRPSIKLRESRVALHLLSQSKAKVWVRKCAFVCAREKIRCNKGLYGSAIPSQEHCHLAACEERCLCAFACVCSCSCTRKISENKKAATRKVCKIEERKH